MCGCRVYKKQEKIWGKIVPRNSLFPHIHTLMWPILYASLSRMLFFFFICTNWSLNTNCLFLSQPEFFSPGGSCPHPTFSCEVGSIEVSKTDFAANLKTTLSGLPSLLDWKMLRTGGMVFAGILCVMGIVILLSKWKQQLREENNSGRLGKCCLCRVLLLWLLIKKAAFFFLGCIVL